MKNIWFIRTDKDSRRKNDNFKDFSENNRKIFTEHGVCPKDVPVELQKKIDDFKESLFPQPKNLNTMKIRRKVIEIKNDLVDSGCLELNEQGKKSCDRIIAYWIAEMAIGDIVFVRNVNQEVFVCKIEGYILEENLKEYDYFSRPVEILQRVEYGSVPEKLWKRTMGRSSLVRNADWKVKEHVLEYLQY